MRVLVTGASGLIGRSTVQELRRRGHQITTLHRGPGMPGLEKTHVATDVRQPAAREAARQAEAIVHLAALGNVEESLRIPLEYNDVNASGTLNLLEGAREGGALFLFASTQRIYQLSSRPIAEDGPLNPTSPYAYSKIVAETYCRQYASLLGVRTAVLRFFSVYGPGQQGRGTSGVVAIFLERALAGLPLVVHGHRRRDLTHVDDVARGIALALEHPWNPGSAYNIATGVGTSLLELAELVRGITGSASPIEEFYTSDTFQPGHSSIGPTPAASPLTAEAQAEEDLVADCTRAKRDLGYASSISVREGVLSWLRWIRQHG